MNNNKGQQFFLSSVILFSITLTIYFIFYPAWKPIIDGFVASTTDPFLQFIILLLPFIILFTVLMSLFIVIKPRGAVF